MRKKITVFTALTLLAVMMTLVCLTSCGNNGQNENTESDNSDDLSVFNYEESDLSEYFKLASLDNLTLDAVKSYIESERAKATVSDYGDKITLKDGSTVEADYILYDADMEKTLLSAEIGEMIVTPREIDAIVQDAAGIIASGINRALQPSLSDAEIAAMMN